MVIVTEDQMRQLMSYVPNIEQLAMGDDVQALLDAIDDVIIGDILAHNDEPSAFGIHLQKIYDAIFYQN